MINHDINALNNFEKNKESDFGIRITRHMKMLRRSANFGHLKAVWSSVMNEPAISPIDQADSHSDPQTFAFDKNIPISKPARIYILSLATVICLREKLLNHVYESY